VKRHPELDHDEEIWVLFTERVIVGMGGAGDTYSAAVEMEQRWAHSAHFELYEDALAALVDVRARGLKVGLLSNSSRNLGEFVAHHGLSADVVLTSYAHGKTKPHESIFRAMLDLLAVEPAEAVMVGDTLDDDVEGALAVGMRAVLLDREGRYPGFAGRLESLGELPAALGLE
jgi:putative hydrolase of the HAD superfamily